MRWTKEISTSLSLALLSDTSNQLWEKRNVLPASLDTLSSGVAASCVELSSASI